MDPIEFSKTIYLGDRGCKCVVLDGWNNRVSIEVNLISRIRDPSGFWNFYTAEDIENGRIAFESVQHCTIQPQGLLPCDWIEIVSVEEVPNSQSDGGVLAYRFRLSLGAYAESGRSEELIMEVIAKGMYLEDPTQPGVRIVD